MGNVALSDRRSEAGSGAGEGKSTQRLYAREKRQRVGAGGLRACPPAGGAGQRAGDEGAVPPRWSLPGARPAAATPEP